MSKPNGRPCRNSTDLRWDAFFNFRFGHTTVPPGVYRRDRKCNFRKSSNGGMALRLCSTWWDSQVREIENQLGVIYWKSIRCDLNWCGFTCIFTVTKGSIVYVLGILKVSFWKNQIKPNQFIVTLILFSGWVEKITATTRQTLWCLWCQPRTSQNRLPYLKTNWIIAHFFSLSFFLSFLVLTFRSS